MNGPKTGGQSVENFGYDSAGNLTSLNAKRNTTFLTNYTYSYANGTTDLAQRQSVTNAGTTTSYHYDAFGRLCWYVTGSSSNTCTSPPAGSTSFNFDANGNRTSMSAGGTTTSYAYNNADELCATSTGGSASCASPTYTYDEVAPFPLTSVFRWLLPRRCPPSIGVRIRRG